jgi:type II secretory ATPase GspE/PulE/Tfp pilus assembly ATPase PilB-like protein
MEQGMRNLRSDGFLKAWMGETCLDEVRRVTSG